MATVHEYAEYYVMSMLSQTSEADLKPGEAPVKIHPHQALGVAYWPVHFALTSLISRAAEGGDEETVRLADEEYEEATVAYWALKARLEVKGEAHDASRNFDFSRNKLVRAIQKRHRKNNVAYQQFWFGCLRSVLNEPPTDGEIGLARKAFADSYPDDEDFEPDIIVGSIIEAKPKELPAGPSI